MNRQQLNQLAQEGESETLEFKKSTGQRSDAAQALCAFLNHRGGRVLIGVERDGSVCGQQVSDKSVEDVVHEIRQIDPPVFPTVERVAVGDGFEVIVVRVQQGEVRPYSYKGKWYKRIGNVTIEMSAEERDRMLLERLHGTRRWENEAAAGWTVNDLDQEELVRTVEESVRRLRTEDPGTRDPLLLLRGLGLVRDGALLRAAAMLFGNSGRLEADFPQCLLRVARFRGVDTTEFADNRQFYGSAFRLLLIADRFMREHLPVAGRIHPGLFERVDDPLYPPIALREALANAICHRDYSIGGGSIAVAIFDDRLEISSSGTLHFGLTATALFEPHESLPWNPLIAQVLYKRGIIERWGRGTLKMVELTELAGLPRPQIEESGGRVTVRFRTGRHAVPRTITRVLTARQQQILDALQREGAMPLRDILAKLPHTTLIHQVKDDLGTLKGLGAVETAGHGRGAIWFVKDHSRQRV